MFELFSIDSILAHIPIGKVGYSLTYIEAI